MSNSKPKLIVILGPTASGKTKLAVELAKMFDGEIISADSRQVYRGMDIGTGKDLAEYDGVRHHLIDVADPQEQFTVADFKRKAEAAIGAIIRRGKVPFLVGGSGLYLQTVVDNFNLEQTYGVDEKLRHELEGKTASELFELLRSKNSAFAERLNNSDRNNRRRLIRYIEMGTEKKKEIRPPKYDSLVLGLMPEKGLMEGKIKKRLIERLEKENMVGEVERLRSQGVSDRRLRDFGLEYKFITDYLNEKYSYEEMVEKLFIAIRQFAKRQITWFRRWERQGKKIEWVQDELKMRHLIENFLK